MKTLISTVIVMVGVVAFDGRASAHCQVPCGIYDDSARLAQLGEDAFTIEKAMRQIAALSSRHDAQSRNQLVRWVNVKEQHAERIMRTVSDYFLAQKVKLPTAKQVRVYYKTLAAYHAVLVAAMKCKQSVDVGQVKTLRKALVGIGAKKLRRH